jgi:hypothetical protein
MAKKKKYRFVPKTYGRGFMPISLEGWLFTLLLTVVMLLSAYVHNMLSGANPTLEQYAGFIVDLFLIIFSSSWYMDQKTDGDLKRRWGKKKK